MTDNKVLTQLSTFINNEPGPFSRLASTLRDCGINLKAFNLVESSEFGILRAIVDDSVKAVGVLEKAGISLVSKSEI